jgi:hypothetical protein
VTETFFYDSIHRLEEYRGCPGTCVHVQSGSLLMIKLKLHSFCDTSRRGLALAATALAACFAPWAHTWNVDL